MPNRERKVKENVRQKQLEEKEHECEKSRGKYEEKDEKCQNIVVKEEGLGRLKLNGKRKRN